MEWISGNIFIRRNVLPKIGDATNGHGHNFDHTTIVFSGRVRVVAREPDVTKQAATPSGDLIFDKTGSPIYFTVPGKVIADREFGDGSPFGRHFLVKAGVWHDITAMMDATEYWCVYAHREPQADASAVNTGWEVSQVFTGHRQAYE